MKNIARKFRLFASTAIVAALPAAGFADSHAVANSVTEFDDLQWAPLAEGLPVEISVLWGSMETGPVGFLIRVAPGFESPLHAHSANYHAVVLQGGPQHWLEGEDKASAHVLGTGSYFSQAAEDFHVDANFGDEPTVSFVYFDGPFDFIGKE